jgi:hypothetical protein
MMYPWEKMFALAGVLSARWVDFNGDPDAIRSIVIE